MDINTIIICIWILTHDSILTHYSHMNAVPSLFNKHSCTHSQTNTSNLILNLLNQMISGKCLIRMLLLILNNLKRVKMN